MTSINFQLNGLVVTSWKLYVSEIVEIAVATSVKLRDVAG